MTFFEIAKSFLYMLVIAPRLLQCSKKKSLSPNFLFCFESFCFY